MLFFLPVEEIGNLEIWKSDGKQRNVYFEDLALKRQPQ